MQLQLSDATPLPAPSFHSGLSRMNRAARIWQGLRATFWFTPAVIVLASIAGAAGLVEVDAWKPADLAAWSPRLFGAGADGSRAMLSAIATSMITVAGVVFSITIVALSLTSTQYSPRVLRNFMRDGPTQVVLGVFLGIFAYCLIVLRTIRGGDEGAFIPSVAVLGGMAYALGGIAVLIFFIHHVAQSIQAASILGRIADDTRAAIDRLFPQELGEPVQEPAAQALPAEWKVVTADRGGYLTSVDNDALMAIAVQSQRVLRICGPVGAFFAEGGELVAAGGRGPVDDGVARQLRAALPLARQRTVEQDAAFGLQQLVDVALRALSPGVNDPTTACMCLDQLGDLLLRLSRREIPGPLRSAGGQLRVVAPAPGFGALTAAAVLPVLRHARGDLQVLESAIRMLELVHRRAVDRVHRRDLEPIFPVVHAALTAVRPRAAARVLRSRVRAMQRAGQT